MTNHNTNPPKTTSVMSMLRSMAGIMAMSGIGESSRAGSAPAYKSIFGSYSAFRETFRDDAARMAKAERRRARKPYDHREPPKDLVRKHGVRVYHGSSVKPGKPFRMTDGRVYQFGPRFKGDRRHPNTISRLT